jgi:hypothetical protein
LFLVLTKIVDLVAEAEAVVVAGNQAAKVDRRYVTVPTSKLPTLKMSKLKFRHQNVNNSNCPNLT